LYWYTSIEEVGSIAISFMVSSLIYTNDHKNGAPSNNFILSRNKDDNIRLVNNYHLAFTYMDTPDLQRAGFFRRLAAMIYDTLIAVAVGMLSALAIITILTVLFETGLLSKQGNEHVSVLIQSSFYYSLIIQVWVSLWVAGFFLWFWKNGGQTLGMRAWRLRIYSVKEGTSIGYGRLIIRLITSLGGLGTLLVLVDFKSKQSLQDRMAGTQMLVLTTAQNDHKNW